MHHMTRPDAHDAAEAAYGGDDPAIEARADALQVRRACFVALVEQARREAAAILSDDPDACHAATGYDWSTIEGICSDFASIDPVDTLEDVRRLEDERDFPVST